MPYTTNKGDTFNKIAAKLGVDPADLIRLNPEAMSRPGDVRTLQIGANLVLPGEAESEGEGQASSTNSEETGSADQGGEINVGGGQTVTKGTPEGEDKAGQGIGIDDGDATTPDLKILTSKEMKWFFDKNAGKWYVEYGLPNSTRTALFEAEPDQMDALFGNGFRPTTYENKTLKQLTQREGSTFSGNIAEVEGEGSFEAHVQEVITVALDEGRLPDWAAQDGVAMDIIFTANSEGKSNEWVVEQLSKTNGFKQRFPQLDSLKNTGNLSTVEAVSAFLEYESGLKSSLKAHGIDEGAASPEIVGNLIKGGHSITVVNDTIKGFDRMKKFQPAMQAFNQVLSQQGLDPISNVQDMLDFVQGKASAEIYDVYEASSIQEAAAQAGLGSVFSADDAISAAYAGNHTLESATAGMQKAAELLLRLRHEVDANKFGLDHEELIDISLGQAPRSGRSQAEINENINRAVLSAQGNLRGKAQSHKSFTNTGTPQAASLRNLRQES